MPQHISIETEQFSININQTPRNYTILKRLALQQATDKTLTKSDEIKKPPN